MDASDPLPSTTQFVADSLDKMRTATTDEERREIYRAIYYRIRARLDVLARKTGLRSAVPEVWTEEISDGADARLEKFFVRASNEKWRQQLEGLNDLMNLAARHMRFFLMDVIRARGRCLSSADVTLPDTVRFDQWLENRMAGGASELDPSAAVMDAEHRQQVLLEFWQTFDQLAEREPGLAALLQKSVVLGMTNVELGKLEGVAESTIRERLNKARRLFLRLYGKDWPFEN
ncbi:MAG: hypothetical protein U0939_26185 [Pirellulales bacterium]